MKRLSLTRPAADTPEGRAARQRRERFPSAMRAADATLMWSAVVLDAEIPRARWSRYAVALHLVRFPHCRCVQCMKCNDGKG